MSDLRSFGIDPCRDLDRFLLKLALLEEYARLRCQAYGGDNGLDHIAVQLEDMLAEGNTIHGNLQNRMEGAYARQ